LGQPLRTNGDLQDWANQGVWLLNSVLTAEIGCSNVHSNLGWQQFTKSATRYVLGLGNLRVAVLWGNAARSMASQLTSVALIESAHPSPLSAYRGFFGSKPFSRTNQYLSEANLQPIEWG
jgi:uracil-DNA glycosylase